MRVAHFLVILIVLGALAGGLWYALERGGGTGEVPAPLFQGSVPGENEREGPGSLAPRDGPAAGGGPGSGRVASPVEGLEGPTNESALRRGRGRAVRGRVVDEFAAPVGGARILYATSRNTAGLRLEDALSSPAGWIEVGETTSDEGGEFELLFHQRGDLRLVARAAGFAPLREERALSPSGETELDDLVLVGGVRLEGHVVDRSGRGIPGAELHELPPDDGGFRIVLFDEGSEPLATTDASGAFVIDQLAAGPFRLRVHHPEHPDLAAQGTTERSGETITGLRYVLEDGFEIAGRVLGLAPGQHAELVVRATLAERGLGDWGGVHRRPRTAEISAKGEFVLRGLREDQSYHLQAIEAGASGNPFFAEPRSARVIARTGEQGVELELREPYVLLFQVVDDASGEPVTELRVEAGRPWMEVLRDGDRDPLLSHTEGRVRYEDVPVRTGETSADLRVRARGFETLSLEDIALEPGVERDLGVLRLTAVPSVTVRVVDAATGKPQHGAWVALLEVEPDDPWSFRDPFAGVADEEELDALSPRGDRDSSRGRTDAEGVAILPSLPGRLGRLHVKHRGYAEYRGEPTPLPRGRRAELEARLLHGGTVIVQVLDGAGEPAAGEVVSHREARGGSRSFSFDGSSGTRKSGGDGTTVFAHLPAGTHHFSLGEAAGGLFIGGGVIFLPGMEDAASEDGGVDVLVGEGTTETVTLRAKPRGTLTGQVTEAGQPLAGATLVLRERREEGDESYFVPGFGGGESSRTDGQGRYSFEDLEVGEYTVTLSHPSRAMADELDVILSAGETRRDFALSVTIVEGRVTDSAGRPAPGVEVRPRRADGGRGSRSVLLSAVLDMGSGPVSLSTGTGSPLVARTDAEGSYSLRGVLPGVALQLATRADDYQPGRSAVFEVAEGETLRGIDVELWEAGTLQLTVTRPDGSPASSCMAELTFLGDPGENEKPEPRREFVGDGGRVTIRSLRPGSWRVEVSAFGLDPDDESEGAAPVEVEVRPGATVAARATLP